MCQLKYHIKYTPLTRFAKNGVRIINYLHTTYIKIIYMMINIKIIKGLFALQIYEYIFRNIKLVMPMC